MFKNTNRFLALPFFTVWVLFALSVGSAFGSEEDPFYLEDGGIALERTHLHEILSIDQEFNMYKGEEGGELLGLMDVMPYEDSPHIYEILFSPYGPGLMYGDPENPRFFTAWFDDLPEQDFTFWNDPGTGIFNYTTQGSMGRIEPSNTIVQDTGPGGPTTSHGKPKVERRPAIRIKIDFGKWLGKAFHSDFIQFFKVLISYGGHTSDCVPFDFPFLPGHMVRCNSNGGPPPQGMGMPSSGQGFFAGDGSKTYVDSKTPGEPHYIACGFKGKQGETYAEMTDAPSMDKETMESEAELDAMMRGMDLDDIEIDWIKVHIDFTAYLLVNGLVVFKIEWEWEWCWDCSDNEPQVNTDVKKLAPVNQKDVPPDQVQALLNFLNGNYHGG